MGFGLIGKASLLAVGAFLYSVPAQANLLGEAFSWQYYGGGAAYNPGGGALTNGTFTVTGGVEGTLTLPAIPNPLPVFNILADDNSITFDYSVNQLTGPWSGSIQSLAPTIFNGVALNLTSASIITGVTINGATNMAGFGPSSLSFTGNQIQIDWANLAFDSSTIVKLDILLNGATSTPEPATVFLSGMSLMLIAGVCRRAIR